MITPFFPQTLNSAKPASAVDVVLSICVPSHHGASSLEVLLPQIKRWAEGWDFSYEIVISDDHSTEQTVELVERLRGEGLPVAYFKQSENIKLASMIGALHRARGKYVIHLADDSQLIPEALADTVRFMQADPEICACYTPWEIQKDAAGISTDISYDQPEELRIFKPGEEADLIGFVVQHGIFPEVAVFRADAARRIVSTPSFCHWAFSHLTTVSAAGAIAFRKTPYYRSPSFSPIRPSGELNGDDHMMALWDNYRGGVEYMVFNLLRRHKLEATDQIRSSFGGLINYFVGQRMRIALRMQLHKKDYVRAYEISSRLAHLDPNVLQTIEQMDRLPLMAMAQILARFANAVPEIEKLLVAGVDDGQALGRLLRDVGLERHILVVPPPSSPSEKNLNTSIVFIARDDLRQSFVDQGYAPSLIVSEGEIHNSMLL